MSSVVPLDEKDLRILALLEKDSKLRTHQLSRRTGIPVTTVHHRIKRLESLGVIASYSVRLDYQKLGKSLLAFILATVQSRSSFGKGVSQAEVAKKIRSLGAEEVFIVTGGTDLLIKVRVADVASLNHFLIEHLRAVPGIDKTQTLIVLDEF